MASFRDAKESDLVNEWSSVIVGLQQHARPQLGVLATYKVAGQTLEQRVLIANLRHNVQMQLT